MFYILKYKAYINKCINYCGKNNKNNLFISGGTIHYLNVISD